MGDWEESALLDEEPIEPSGQIERWRRGSVTGAVLTGFALGLQEVLYPRRNEEIAIVVEAGDPPGDRAVALDLDPDDPDASSVTIRR
ncbi:MAG: hypothetical protein IT195_06430 [Microthrixaceae bacterium]|nr:hypothetical protein [Microthrixaceae bacterium]